MRRHDEHAPWCDFALLARLDVGHEVRRIRALELSSDTAPHDTHAVDGIDEGVGVGAKEVACRGFNDGELSGRAVLQHSVRTSRCAFRCLRRFPDARNLGAPP